MALNSLPYGILLILSSSVNKQGLEYLAQVLVNCEVKTRIHKIILTLQTNHDLNRFQTPILSFF